jgi:hypothetical protein
VSMGSKRQSHKAQSNGSRQWKVGQSKSSNNQCMALKYCGSALVVPLLGAVNPPIQCAVQEFLEYKLYSIQYLSIYI